jgi:hypothetical protein
MLARLMRVHCAALAAGCGLLIPPTTGTSLSLLFLSIELHGHNKMLNSRLHRGHSPSSFQVLKPS